MDWIFTQKYKISLSAQDSIHQLNLIGSLLKHIGSIVDQRSVVCNRFTWEKQQPVYCALLKNFKFFETNSLEGNICRQTEVFIGMACVESLHIPIS